MGCPKCSTAVRRLDHQAEGRGLKLLRNRKPNLRVVACADCRTQAADSAPSDGSGIGPGGLQGPVDLTNQGTLQTLAAIATNPALLNAATVIASGGKLSLTPPTLGSSLPANLGGAPAPVTPPIPVNPAADAAHAKKVRTIEIAVVAGLVILTILAVVAYKRSQATP